jgi:hypothetical protein
MVMHRYMQRNFVFPSSNPSRMDYQRDLEVYTDTQLQGHYPQASQEKKKKKKHFSP